MNNEKKLKTSNRTPKYSENLRQLHFSLQKPSRILTHAQSVSANNRYPQNVQTGFAKDNERQTEPSALYHWSLRVELLTYRFGTAAETRNIWHSADWNRQVEQSTGGFSKEKCAVACCESILNNFERNKARKGREIFLGYWRRYPWPGQEKCKYFFECIYRGPCAVAVKTGLSTLRQSLK